MTAELRDISRFGFEARWSRYWPLVFNAVEVTPTSVADLRDAIVKIEEQFARDENRPDLAKLLGNQRAVWQEEAHAVFLDFIEPFVNADGTREERQALYHELQQVKQDVDQKIAATERAHAYPEYVLALDYVTSFASIVTRAFTKQSYPKPTPAQAPAPAVSAPVPNTPATDSTAPNAPAPSTPAATEIGAAAPALDAVPPIAAPPGPAETASAKPKRRWGLIASVLILVMLIAAGGSAMVLRPDLVNFDKILAMLDGGSFDASVDTFMARTAEQCEVPDRNVTLQHVIDQGPCIVAARQADRTAFDVLLTEAGGSWTGTPDEEQWTAPEGSRRDKLTLAWEHLRGINETYDDMRAESVVFFDGEFYPPDEERDAVGWRFAIWMCICNAAAEDVDLADPDRRFRAFVSTPDLVTTPHTYTTLVGLLRDYFLSGDHLGDPVLVAQTADQFELPQGLPAGPRLAGPFESRRGTEEAIEEVTALYKELGFEIIEISLR